MIAAAVAIFVLGSPTSPPRITGSKQITNDGLQKFSLVTDGNRFVAVLDVTTQHLSQVPGSKGLFGPRWSPDGRYIVAISYSGDVLMLFDVKAQRWRALPVHIDGFFGYLAWSPDSAYVYFDNQPNHDPGFFRLRISDAKLERVVSLKELRAFRSQFGPGSWSGLGPGETPLFVHNISTQEIYALDWQFP